MKHIFCAYTLCETIMITLTKVITVTVTLTLTVTAVTVTAVTVTVTVTAVTVTVAVLLTSVGYDYACCADHGDGRLLPSRGRSETPRQRSQIEV